MKTIQLAPIISAILLTSAAFAQSPANPSAVDTGGTIALTSPRDGFTLRGTEPLITRNGVTTKVDQEVRFPNGLRVLPNGTVTLPDGSNTALRPNQLLTFEGAFHEMAAVATDAAPQPAGAPAPAPAPTASVGISSRDGITISGAEVFMTRNGVMEKVTSDVRLSNGTTVKSDGKIVSDNGNTISLRAGQVLGFDGVLRDAPVSPNPAGPAPSSSSPSR